jgi:predicted permease
MEYVDFMGGLISSEFPYIVLIGIGYLFGRLNLIQKDGIVALSKLTIEIFLPVYLFLQIGRSNSVDQLKTNALIVVSNLMMIAIAAIIGLLYIFITKMDKRYRFSWLALLCFCDIRRIHYLITNSFCYHLHDQTLEEKKWCSDILANNYTHLFFQQVIMWYIALNLIRLDRFCYKKVIEAKKVIEKKDESKCC